jgi:hypothetical protein
MRSRHFPGSLEVSTVQRTGNFEARRSDQSQEKAQAMSSKGVIHKPRGNPSRLPRYSVGNPYVSDVTSSFEYFAIVIHAEDDLPLGPGKFYAQVDARQEKAGGNGLILPSTDHFRKMTFYELSRVEEFQRIIMVPRSVDGHLSGTKEVLRVKSRGRIWIGYEDFIADAQDISHKPTSFDSTREYSVQIFLMKYLGSPVLAATSWGESIACLCIENDGFFKSVAEVGEPWHKGYTRVYVLELHVSKNIVESEGVDPRKIWSCEEFPKDILPDPKENLSFLNYLLLLSRGVASLLNNPSSGSIAPCEQAERQSEPETQMLRNLLECSKSFDRKTRAIAMREYFRFQAFAGEKCSSQGFFVGGTVHPGPREERHTAKHAFIGRAGASTTKFSRNGLKGKQAKTIHTSKGISIKPRLPPMYLREDVGDEEKEQFDSLLKVRDLPIEDEKPPHVSFTPLFPDMPDTMSNE